MTQRLDGKCQECVDVRSKALEPLLSAHPSVFLDLVYYIDTALRLVCVHGTTDEDNLKLKQKNRKLKGQIEKLKMRLDQI